MKKHLITAGALALALAAAAPASAAPARIPPAQRCVHVTVITRAQTGHETDLPVIMCGIARRWGPWTCATTGQFGAGMRLTCKRG